MRIRRELLTLFRDYARREGLQHYHVSVACGFSQPRAWNLLHGQIEQFNSETLINILARFGFTLELTVRDHRRVKIWCSYAQYEESGAELKGSRRRL